MENYEKRYNEIMEDEDCYFKFEKIQELLIEARKNKYPEDFCEKLNHTKLLLVNDIKKYNESHCKPFGFEINVAEVLNKCNDIYSSDSFMHLVNIFRNFTILTFDNLKERTLERISNPLLNLFPNDIYDSTGRKRISVPTDITKKDIDELTEKYIKYEKFLIYWWARFLGTYYRIVINDWIEKHVDALDVIASIVNNSKMISDDLKNDTIKMFKYGLIDNDLSTAIRLSNYIIEETTKHICESNGIDPYRTVSKKDYNIEETNMFSYLWKKDIFKEKFGEDIVFNFKNLFDSSDSLNIRTDVAHGKVPPKVFEGSEYYYFLLLFLYMIYIYE